MSQQASESKKLKFVISLSVLEDLGINLYGSLPEVLAEAVANSWDADASLVEIAQEDENRKIIIYDDGIGMTREELQNYYLTVGHKRRGENRIKTEKGRAPMGRKGIGKLSLFSIANIVQVDTTKNGERTTIRMNVDDILNTIKKGDGKEFEPDEISVKDETLKKGTKITLSEIKKKRFRIEDVKRNLARRFFVLGQEKGFDISLNGKSLSIEDRGYRDLVEYLWLLGEDAKRPKSARETFAVINNILGKETKQREQGETEESKREVTLITDTGKIRGWIGTAKDSGMLAKSEANGISIMVRGKMAHPNILPYFDIRELASNYILGEIHADFLDVDDKPDIATTDRQRFNEDDERFQELKEEVHKIVRRVISDRSKFKEENAEKDATVLLPLLKEWLKDLKGDQKKSARKILAAVNKTALSDDEKREYYKRAVIAHQNYVAWGELRKLDELSDKEGHIEEILDIFQSLDTYEAASYYEIAKGRIKILRTLENIVRKEDKIEEIVRDYLKEHLWLLDPSWDRATEPVEAEITINKYLGNTAEKFSEEQKRFRFDIVYRQSSNKHIVIELKRYGRKVSTGELVDQVGKYKKALEEGLTAKGEKNKNFDIICLVGPKQDFLTNEEARKEAEASLRPYGAIVMTYDEMIDRSLQAYKGFLKAEEKSNKLIHFLEKLSSSSLSSENG